MNVIYFIVFVLIIVFIWISLILQISVKIVINVYLVVINKTIKMINVYIFKKILISVILNLQSIFLSIFHFRF